MRQLLSAAMAAVFVLASAQANAAGNATGRCMSGYSDDTLVRTEQRGDLTIAQVTVGDRVWSFNEIVGKEGWSEITQRIDKGRHYTLLSNFSEPGSSAVSPACWRIKHAN